ncbi:MAG: carboxypeptidase regulatory-like domain-containing protein [Deltaproteobacteria bacterium]|nr:carboxypeptidase regulatory-like domain-containing protein [Deltaproteobacteria bacterium]
MRPRYVGFLAALVAAGCGSSSPDVPGSSGGLSRVSGSVYMPVSGATVDVYRPGEDLRGPPFTQLGPLGPTAAFSIELPPGDFLLVARRRTNGEETGPVREGDVKTDPVRIHVEAGKPLSFNILAYVKQGNPKESLGSEAEWKAAISGQVTDPEGKPVEGVRVHLYEHVQMSERPKYVSARTGPDGRYEVKLPKAGTFYLCARDKYGGPPKVGDLYGRYDKGTVEPSAVIVPETGVVRTVDITVHTVW